MEMGDRPRRDTDVIDDWDDNDTPCLLALREGAKLGDTRVTETLDALATKNARDVKIEFQDSFDIGRYIDDEEVYD